MQFLLFSDVNPGRRYCQNENGCFEGCSLKQVPGTRDWGPKIQVIKRQDPKNQDPKKRDPKNENPKTMTPKTVF